MPYSGTKVYFDGSHYISIPRTTRPAKARKKQAEDIITVAEEIKINEQAESAFPGNGDAQLPHTAENVVVKEESPESTSKPIVDIAVIKTERKMTKKELFNKLYSEHMNLTKAKRRAVIIKTMLPHFQNSEDAAEYVDSNTRRKYRNLTARRIRCARKANLQEFNYFVTFTYDGKLHTEESFVKKLKCCLGHFCTRKGWRYIGVWERSPEKKRLHFHGLFYIPEGTMPGFMFEKEDYNLNTRKMQVTVQNTYFNEKFGRSDFEAINDKNGLYDAMAYIMKYIEKTGQRIVYSKGLPQFFISDITDADIVCRMGDEDKKLLLFDDFSCWDEGCLTGKVSNETIKKMRGTN